jgi:hypothetical protein
MIDDSIECGSPCGAWQVLRASASSSGSGSGSGSDSDASEEAEPPTCSFSTDSTRVQTATARAQPFFALSLQLGVGSRLDARAALSVLPLRAVLPAPLRHLLINPAMHLHSCTPACTRFDPPPFILTDTGARWQPYYSPGSAPRTSSGPGETPTPGRTRPLPRGRRRSCRRRSRIKIARLRLTTPDPDPDPDPVSRGSARWTESSLCWATARPTTTTDPSRRCCQR